MFDALKRQHFIVVDGIKNMFIFKNVGLVQNYANSHAISLKFTKHLHNVVTSVNNVLKDQV